MTKQEEMKALQSAKQFVEDVLPEVHVHEVKGRKRGGIVVTIAYAGIHQVVLTPVRVYDKSGNETDNWRMHVASIRFFFADDTTPNAIAQAKVAVGKLLENSTPFNFAYSTSVGSEYPATEED